LPPLLSSDAGAPSPQLLGGPGRLCLDADGLWLEAVIEW